MLSTSPFSNRIFAVPCPFPCPSNESFDQRLSILEFGDPAIMPGQQCGWSDKLRIGAVLCRRLPPTREEFHHSLLRSRSCCQPHSAPIALRRDAPRRDAPVLRSSFATAELDGQDFPWPASCRQ